MMRLNGVADELVRRSRFSDYVELDALDDNKFQSWNRPTHSWKLSCEDEGKTRQDAFEKT